MAEFGVVTVDDDKLLRQPYYDLELTVLGANGSTSLVRTRSPFVPTDGMQISTRMKVRRRAEWGQEWAEETRTYRIVGRPALFIDEVAIDSITPEVTIECDVKEETR